MNRQRVVLLIEDHEEILSFNRDALLMEGYEVLTALTLSEARNKIADTLPDAIILDIMLPDGNGLDFCAELREQTDAPILFLTCLDEKEPLLQGLRAGGDDYVTKPYDIDELLARVAAQLRKLRIQDIIEYGPLTLHLLSQQAFLNGNDMLLAKKEFAILLLLVRNKGKTLAKEYIYEKAWGQLLLNDDNALTKQMSTLKKKLGEGSGKIILTASRGEGYLLEILE